MHWKVPRERIGILRKRTYRKVPETEQALVDIHPYWRRVLVQQNIPEKLKPLEELSRNLWWSWTQDAIDLFASIDPELWKEVMENPVELLERLSLETLKKLETDTGICFETSGGLWPLRAIWQKQPKEGMPSISLFQHGIWDPQFPENLFGGTGPSGRRLSEGGQRLQYSSDWRGICSIKYGYFRQMISAGGEQVALSDAQDFSRLPVSPVRDDEGNWKYVQIVLARQNPFCQDLEGTGGQNPPLSAGYRLRSQSGRGSWNYTQPLWRG